MPRLGASRLGPPGRGLCQVVYPDRPNVRHSKQSAFVITRVAMLKTFSCNLVVCNSTWAKLWGLYLEMQLTRSLSFSCYFRTRVSGDSVNVVHLRL